MKGFTLAATLAVAVSGSAVKRQSSNTPPITIKGNAFYKGNDRFYIKGVDYQPGGSSDPIDPIADPSTCERDISKFQELGLNTVRIYTVDNSANHDECMQKLSEAGMYLALDVNSGTYSINRDNPSPSYNDVYLQSVFATVEMFAKYDNTLLFFSGNEIINTPQNSDCAPYIKAVTRDMKAYMAARKLRQIPVGYSAADVAENRLQTAMYLNCGADSARSDFFAFNDYSYCNSDFHTSGWDQKVQTYSNYSIPLFLSEYGCNKHTPRTFPEVADLYSDEMSSVYSGGLVYEYSLEADNPGYGLVKINGNNVQELQDFTNLQKMLKNAQTPSGAGGAHNGQPAQCPPKDQYWAVGDDLIPQMPQAAQAFLKNGAGDGPGLQGPGSQNSGPSSHPMVTPTGTVASTAQSVDDSSSPGAAADIKPATLFYTGLALFSTFVGATLL